MKTFTQKLIVLAVAVMLVSLVLAGACQAITATFKNVSIGSVSGKEGEKVKVEIKATEDLTIEDGGLLVKFDNKKLKYDSVATATIADTMIMANNRVNSSEGADGVIIAITSTGEDATTIKKGTVIATVTFEILKGAKGTQTLTLVDDQDEAQTAISTGKVTATEVTTPTKPEEDKKPSTGTTEGNKKPADTNKKPTTTPNTNKNNKKDNTPATGVVNYIVVGSMITLVAVISLAVISKRK